jgi:hypothetical protein
VALGEAGGVGKPAERVAEGADGDGDEDAAVAGIVDMLEDELVAAPGLDAEADEVALAGLDEDGVLGAFEEDVAGVDVPEADDEVGLVGEADAGAEVEVEAQPVGALLVGMAAGWGSACAPPGWRRWWWRSRRSARGRRG